MKKSIELAIEVLIENGVIFKTDSGYSFKATEEKKVNEVAIIDNGWIMEIASNSVGGVGENSTYDLSTPIKRIMAAYKIARGIPYNDSEWDRNQFSRYARAAKRLLNAFGGEEKKAAYWLQDYAKKMKSIGFDWSLEAAERSAWDTVRSVEKDHE